MLQFPIVDLEACYGLTHRHTQGTLSVGLLMPNGCIPRCHHLVPDVLERNLPMLGQAGGLKMVSNYVL